MSTAFQKLRAAVAATIFIAARHSTLCAAEANVVNHPRAFGAVPYSNQTLALRFEPAGGTNTPMVPAARAPRPGPYRNITRALSFEPALPGAPPVAIRQVRWPAVKALLAAGDVVLIDTRPYTDFQRRRIPGAISIPSETPDADLQAAMASFDNNQPIIVYCSSGGCSSSRTFAERLARLGFTNLYDMAGGFAEHLATEPQVDSLRSTGNSN